MAYILFSKSKKSSESELVFLLYVTAIALYNRIASDPRYLFT